MSISSSSTWKAIGLDVLRGAKETIERCAPVMLVEVFKNDEKLIRTFCSR
ncbi:hypothetical protein [Caballeronia sp. Sq4a]|nr:hypothetical protein [Caballeronia sp. Sq4a]